MNIDNAANDKQFYGTYKLLLKKVINITDYPYNPVTSDVYNQNDFLHNHQRMYHYLHGINILEVYFAIKHINIEEHRKVSLHSQQRGFFIVTST